MAAATMGSGHGSVSHSASRLWIICHFPPLPYQVIPIYLLNYKAGADYRPRLLTETACATVVASKEKPALPVLRHLQEN